MVKDNRNNLILLFFKEVLPGKIMLQFLHGAELWSEIRSRARKTKRLTAIVAYIGKNPEGIIRWPKNATLLADLSEDSVKRGACSARGALKLFFRGVRVFQVSGLHAKVYIFDDSAIVCSANLSKISSDHLEEAGILITDKSQLKAVQVYLRFLMRDLNTVELDERILRSRASLEPKAPQRPIGTHVTQSRSHQLSPRIWLIPCQPDRDETATERAEKRRYAKEEYGSDSGIYWYNRCRVRTYKQVHDGETMFFVWEATPKSKWCRLEGPFKSLGGVDLGSRFGERRYCLPYVRFNTLDKRLDKRQFGRLLKFMRDNRNPDEAIKNLKSKDVSLSGADRDNFKSWFSRLR
jgi:hypothetical protein